MNTTLVTRTIRNFFSRKSPYFAHLCVTQRCNLKCSYCQAWQQKSGEADLDGMKRIIDILDSMGIAVLSITGGEPLLRPDIFAIIDYAKTKNFYVRITSNGTMPREKYQQLLETNIDSLSISLDGVKEELLPYAHEGGKILETIDFIARHEIKKRFSLSCVLSQGNRGKIEDIVGYVEQRYPQVGIFVQPVVVGAGNMRNSDEQRVDPGFLRGIDRLLDPDFFIDACIDYFKNDNFRWKCLAGQLFFDVKPNGAFWICQDYPTRLSVLDPDFLGQWKTHDFAKERKRCVEGCTYSCYFLTQKSFEIRHCLDFFSLLKSLSHNSTNLAKY